MLCALAGCFAQWKAALDAGLVCVSCLPACLWRFGRLHLMQACCAGAG